MNNMGQKVENHRGERTAGWLSLGLLAMGRVREESASLKPFCKDLVLKAGEYHLLACFLLISYVLLPGTPIAPGSATFPVRGLFLQPAPEASVTPRA